MTRASSHLGVEPVSEASVFTNCGKTETPETPMKSAKKRLTRVPFKVSRLMEFCTPRELVNQTGHQEAEWPLVIGKELVDNALDAAEDAHIPPVVSITVKAGTEFDAVAFERRRYRLDNHHQGQRPGYSGGDHQGHSRLQHPGVVA